MAQPRNFDILDYLNDLYLNRVMPGIDVGKAGGYHNRHGNENTDAAEEIEENKKKRIDIPNAKIRYFQLGYEQDVEEYNETGTESSSADGTENEQGGTGYNEIFNEGAQKNGLGGGYTEDVVKISENNPTKSIVQNAKTLADDLII